MPLESATYLNNLVVSNPSSSDLMSQADDHIRMLKSVLQNTFPNVNGPITSTPHQLNHAVVPVGGVIMWSGSPAALPTGWRLCDGGTYAKSDGSGNITVPDLREKFVVGCGGTNSVPLTAPTVGTTGGVASNTPSVTLGTTALTQANLPACSFTVTDPGHTHTATSTVNDPGHFHNIPNTVITSSSQYLASANAVLQTPSTGVATNTKTTGITVSVTNTSNSTGITVASGGSDTPHGHSVTTTSMDNRPPFYTLAFIIKI